jgi:hypothetical protein
MKTMSTETATFAAYRYPTTEEIDAGRGADDMVHIGDYASHDGAFHALPNGRGQIQAGRWVGPNEHRSDGEVFSY